MATGAERRTLATLGYHKIGPAPGDWDTWFYIPEATFLDQLGYLRENGWQVLDLAALLAALADPAQMPARAALLTFDDGYRSFLGGALGGLRRFGYPAVMFVPTAYIGGRNAFDADNEPDEPICGWDDLHALERQGVAVQSHGVWHRAFSELTPAEQKEELVRSRAVLEDGLGRPVEVLSYPYGDAGAEPSAVPRLLARAGYRAAFRYGGGPTPWPAADPFRLARLAMGPDTDLGAELDGVGQGAGGD